MSWIDIAAAISAQRHSNRPVVTASIDALNFVAPAYVGWVITLQASVNAVHNTSMEVGVRVDGENPLERTHHHIATAYLTFVALGDNGKPTKVCGLIPETDDEKRRAEQAIKRRDLRLQARRI